MNIDTFATELAVWIASGCVQPTHYFLKPILVASYFKASGFEHFVETGTYFGRTTEIIARMGAVVDTVELSESLWAEASSKFAGEINVRCHLGDSGQMMDTIIRNAGEKPILYWLDGHYSGEGTACGTSFTPIMRELAAIATRGHSRDLIMIDDIRCCGTNGYPRLDFLIEFGQELFNNRPAIIRNDCLIFSDPILHEKAVELIPELIKGHFKL